MRVCVDCTPLLGFGAGVKTYLFYLSRYLRKSAGHHHVSMFPLLDGYGRLDHRSSTIGRHATTLRAAFVRFANIDSNPVMNVISSRTDVFHVSNLIRNPPRNTKLTATIHDLTTWLMPELHSPENIAFDKEFAERTVKRADKLIAVSENTKKDAINVLGLQPERIEVIYHGIPDAYYEVFEHPSRSITFLREKYSLQRPYVLFVGTIEPRKNVDRLIDAYTALKKSLREEFELVVAGLMGWARPETVNRLSSGESGVRYLGYVPEEDLPVLTGGATIFVYPSLYEGFGFPLVQAMAAGVPSIASTAGSLPEIAGDAALLVDPLSVDDLRSAMEKLLTSPGLRAEILERGRRRTERYRWEECASKTWTFFAGL